jgi:hypothetical protein
MGASAALGRRFDFARMRTMLRQTPAEVRSRRSASRVRQAVRTLLCARYVEWFERRNTT